MHDSQAWVKSYLRSWVSHYNSQLGLPCLQNIVDVSMYVKKQTIPRPIYFDPKALSGRSYLRSCTWLAIYACLWATSIKIMDKRHTILHPYQEYFSHTGRSEGDIMKGCFWLHILLLPVGLKLRTTRSANQGETYWAPPHQPIWEDWLDAQVVLITSFLHMQL